MDTERSEAVPGAFKRHLRRREPLMDSILVEEIDLAMIEHKAEQTRPRSVRIAVKSWEGL